MKNILNKIGAVSKPVIFGAALGIATVAVGVGVATNLMSDGPKGASGRVLGQYSGDTASVGSGGGSYDAYSREALEQQMAAARAAREGGTALDYLGKAGRGRLAYGDNTPAYENGVVDPMAMNNAGYESDEGAAAAGGRPDIGTAMSQFNATVASAHANAGLGGAGAQGVGEEAALGGQLEKAGPSGTKLNKLNSTSRIGGGSGVSGSKSGSGGSRNMGAIQGMTNDRAGQQAVPSVNMSDTPTGNISGIAGAKHGRLGAMGGSNSRGGTSGNGGNGQAYFMSSMGELTAAQRYSALSKGSVYGNAEKGFVEAGAAFDGSGDASAGVQISGDTPMVEKAASLEREANSINKKGNKIGQTINQITQDSDTRRKALKGLTSTVMMMASLALVGIGLVMAAKNLAWTGFGGAIAVAIAAAFAAAIIGLGMGMMGMYVNKIAHIGTEGLNDPGAYSHLRYWLPPLMGGLPFLGLFAGGTASNGVKAFMTGITKAMLYGGGMLLLSSAGGFFGK